MNRLHKIITLTALGFIAGMGSAQAWQGPDNCHPGWQGRKPDPAQVAKFMEKRLAVLHDALKLTPAQAPAWNSFVEKSKPPVAAGRPDFEALSKLPTPERLDRMQALAKERQDRMAARTSAVKEFYAQLSPEQQKVFDAEFMKPMRGGPGRDGKGLRKPRAE